MPAFGGSLFDFMLQREAAKADYYRQKQDEIKRQQTDDAQKERDFWSKQLAGDFDRRLKLIELQSKMAGALGQPAPHPDSFDSRLGEAVEPHYMEGEFMRNSAEQEAALKREDIGAKLYGTDIRKYGIDTFNENQDLERQRKAFSDKEQQALRRGDQAEAQRWHDLSYKLGLGRNAAMMALANATREQRIEDKKEKQLIDLGEKLGPSEHEHADAAALAAAASEKGGPSGIGTASGRVPDWAWSIASKLGSTTADEALNNRTAVNSLKKLAVAATGGKALTWSEIQLTLEGYHVYPGAPKEAFRVGIRNLIRDAKLGEQQIKNVYPPDVVKEYERRSEAVPLPSFDEDENEEDENDRLMGIRR